MLTQADGPDLTAKDLVHILTDSTRTVLNRRFRVLMLVRDAYAQLTEHEDTLTNVREDLMTFMRLLLAWAQRTYQHVPWTPLILMTGALLYFVSPVDLIPDALAGIGLLDDVAIISIVVRMVRGELDRFRAWEARHALPPGLTRALKDTSER